MPQGVCRSVCHRWPTMTICCGGNDSEHTNPSSCEYVTFCTVVAVLSEIFRLFLAPHVQNPCCDLLLGRITHDFMARHTTMVMSREPGYFYFWGRDTAHWDDLREVFEELEDGKERSELHRCTVVINERMNRAVKAEAQEPFLPCPHSSMVACT